MKRRFTSEEYHALIAAYILTTSTHNTKDSFIELVHSYYPTMKIKTIIARYHQLQRLDILAENCYQTWFTKTDTGIQRVAVECYPCRFSR